MAIRPAQPVSNFLAGRQARQDEEYATSRNALAQFEAASAPMEQQRRNALIDQQIQSGQQQLSAEQKKIAFTTLKQAFDSGRPRQFVIENVPVLASKLREQGMDLASMDDQSASQILSDLARQFAGEAGIAPAGPAGPMSAQGKIGADVRAGYLTEEQGHGALNPGMSPYQRESLDIQRQRLAASQNKPPAHFVALTPDEVAAAGLPAGTSAQRDTQTGKIDVLSRRDTTATLSQKDAATARQKLTTIRVARKQLENLKKAFAEGRAGLNAFGPAQGLMPTQAGKKFDAAIDQMRGTWTGLKRVPGVGAMSDYESRMDASQFPSRNEYESVVEQKLQGMEDQLALLENGYTGLLNPGTNESQQSAAPEAAPRATQGISEQDYASLPSGTQYRAPDGSIRTKR